MRDDPWRFRTRPRTRLTRRGVVVITSGVVLAITAIVIRVGELYAISAAAMIVPVTALSRVRLVARRTRLEVICTVTPRRPEVGRPCVVHATVRGSARSVFEVSIPAPFASAPARALVDGLPRGGSELIENVAIAIHRGRHKVGPAELRIPDGLGFACARWTTGVAREVLVLPAFVPVRDVPTLPAEESVSGRVRRSPQRGTEFRALRDYQRGDDLRQIHWRASARHDTLLVREHEPLALPRLTVLLDDRAVSHPGPDSLEWAVTAAASILSGAGNRGHGVRLVTSDARAGKPGYGRAAIDPLIERLALVAKMPTTSLVAAVRASTNVTRSGAGVAIISPSRDEESVAALCTARRRFDWAGALLIEPGGPDALTATVGARMSAAGWQVVRVRPGRDRIEEAWKTLLGRAAHRTSLPSRS